MFRDLRSFLQQLEASGELAHIAVELSPVHEIAAAIKYVAQKKGTAVFLDKVKGYEIPIVANLFGKGRYLAMALGVNEEEVTETFVARREDAIKPKMVTEAPVKEVLIDRDVDICKVIPVLTIHEKDAGPYLTAAITAAKDPETGVVGMGVYRLQVKGRDILSIHLVTPPLSGFLAKAEQMNKPLEVAIAVGCDPVTFFTSGIPVPGGVDKFDVAGGLAQAPIELVKCHSVDVDVPAAAEFVLEGELIPGRRELEGPFGASTGLYSSCDNPVAQIKLISHRRNPIYHAFIPFGPEEDVLIGLPWDADALLQLKRTLPFVRKVHFHGLSGLVLVQIDKESEEGVRDVVEHLFPNPFVKAVVVTDVDVNIEEPNEVDWALSRVRFDKDLIVKSDQPGSPLDPSAIGPETPAVEFFPMITKIGIDATKPLTELERFERINVPAGIEEKVSTMLQGVVL